MNEQLNEERQEEIQYAEQEELVDKPKGSQSLDRKGGLLGNYPIQMPPSHPQANDYSSIEATVRAMEGMKQLAEILIKSGMCPLKKAEDVILAIITGNQYGLPYITSINNIHPINGKPAMSAHLHRAMLLRHGITFSKVKDYEPIYTFYKADAEGKAIKTKKKYKDENGNIGVKEVGIAIAMGRLEDAPKEPHIKKETNRITEYRFTRRIKNAEGKWETLETTSSFSMADAQTAGLLSKDVWNNYPARMCDSRAYTIGSKEIAADILLGMPTIGELAEVYDIPYEVDEGMQETISQQ
jgi:hypothetical protein